MAQTPDGYLWLGTDFGLLRFDGVKNVPWQPPPSQHLPSSQIWSLLATPDGSLWIGTFKGLASSKEGRFTLYPELAGMAVGTLLEDRDGTVWASAVGVSTGRLCAIQNGSVHCYGQDGSIGHGLYGLYEDSKGNLWAGGSDGLWRWKPGNSIFYPLPGNGDDIRAFAEAGDGALLVSTRGSISQLMNGKIGRYPLPGAVGQLRTNKMLRDRDGGLWIGTFDRGLVHVHQGRTDVFSQTDGLSGDTVGALFEDREGSIWVATSKGLDRFRSFVVTTLSVNHGPSNVVVDTVQADKDGSVWLGTEGGLKRWNNGQITNARTGSAKSDGKLNGQNPNSLFEDSHGRIWVSTRRGLGYLENDRFIPLTAAPGGNVSSITEDNAGNLWIANQQAGLIHLSPGGEVQMIPWSGLGHKDYASALIADSVHGGLWIGFLEGGVAYFSDGGVRASYGPADGLGEGYLRSLKLDPDGTLWAGTEGGLSRLKNGHVATLTGRNGLPCDMAHWAIEDDDHSFWLYMSCGLVRIARSELDAWAAAEDGNKETKRAIQTTVFDNADGVGTVGFGSSYCPRAAKTADGKLWFTGWGGVSIVDPHHLALNKLPPPVHVEQIVADHQTYAVASDASGSVRLPPRVRDLEIDYTALSLVAPEKVFFRYKLEGWDHDWQDAGTRRQAFYTNLPPRKFRFRVMACNNSGVWNEAGAAMDFAIAPAYWQTWWFRSLCVAAFLGMLFGAYRFRLHQVEQRFNTLLEGRVAERTRIARDLHDTMLQSFQAVLLKLHAMTFVIRDRPAEAENTLGSVIEQVSEAITEGRDAVQGMRSSTVVSNDLARAITLLGDELTSHQGENRPEFSVQVEGTSRDLAPILRDDIYRISGEALRNAFLHGQATRIEVEIRYDARQFRLRIRDNGKGIDPKILEEGGRVGHYGVPGMKERAKLVGGKLTVWSELNSGTEIELTVPAAVAYAKSSGARWPKFWRKGA